MKRKIIKIKRAIKEFDPKIWVIKNKITIISSKRKNNKLHNEVNERSFSL